MDHRDRLAMFGAFLPHGAEIDEQRMLLRFTVESEEPVSEALVAEADAAWVALRILDKAATQASAAVAEADRDGGYARPDSDHVSALRADLRRAMDVARSARDAASDASGRAYQCVEVEHALPFTWEICSSCRGRGSYVNPSIDAHGISAEEWDRDWSDEDREGYFEGRYDVTCQNCRGRRVEPQPTEPAAYASAEHKAAWKAYQEWAESESADRRERESEARFGY